MKSKIFSFLAFSAVLFFLASCGSVMVAKKRHSDGYYVSIGKSGNSQQITNNTLASKKERVAPIDKIVIDNKNEKTEALSSPVITETENSFVSEKSETKTQQVQLSASNKKNTLKNMVAKKMLKSKLDVKTPSANKKEISDTFLIVLILTILLPPLGVFLYKQEVKPTIISLLLLLAGIILGILLGGNLGSILLLLGVVACLVYSIFYIFDKI
jgi:uncharacterized membrane protein YqaE (UPF0057 family)